MFRLFCLNNIYYIYNLNWGQSKLNSNNMENVKFEINQVVRLKFLSEEITATVKGVHYYPHKTKKDYNVKYDLILWLKDAEETRIYNVEERFLTAM